MHKHKIHYEINPKVKLQVVPEGVEIEPRDDTFIQCDCICGEK